MNYTEKRDICIREQKQTKKKEKIKLIEKIHQSNKSFIVDETVKKRKLYTNCYLKNE